MKTRTIMSRWILPAVGLLLSLLFAGCATSSGNGGTASTGGSAGEDYPDWFLNPQSVYADDTYLTAIGTGDSRRSAEEQAMSGLSQIFEARVSVDSRQSERYRELMSSQGTMSETEIQLAENSSVQSNQTLLNVQFGEAAVDETGRVHVIAYLERLPTSRVYRDLIVRNGRQVEQFLNEADGSNELIREYAYVSAAAVVAGSNEVLLDQLNIIMSGMGQTVQLPYVYDRVLQQRADLASAMRVSVSIEGDSEGRVTAILRQALSEERLPIVDSDAVLQVRGAVRVDSIPSNADFESVRWTLNLDMTSRDGRSLVNYEQEDRASGISEEAARAFAYRDIETAVSRDFVTSLRSYFDGVVLGR
jgi:predicted small secreted protein